MKHVLVTGGTGFIGSSLVRMLVRTGHKVRILDSNLRGSTRRIEDVKDQIEMVEGDIRDLKTVRAACDGVDAVHHLAYLNGTEYFYTMPELVLEIAVKGMMNVLDACIDAKVRELILASSSEVYQVAPYWPADEKVPMSIPDPLNPRFSYGGGKIICELLALNYGRTRFDRVIVFRPHNVFGADMGWEHVIPQFALRMAEAVTTHPTGPIPFPIQGSGEETRAFIYIDDFVEGLRLLGEKGEHMGIYHIGTMDERRIRDVAESVGGVFGRKIEIIPGEAAKGGTNRRVPDISKMKAIGFNPSVSFEDGVRATVEWYRANAGKKPQSKLGEKR